MFTEVPKCVLMKMEAESTSETSVIFWWATWRFNPEDSSAHTRRIENIESHRSLFVSIDVLD
jgi:hypothetical protein